MKIYYYHTRPIHEALDEWENHLHPGHILYGLTHFGKHGIETILHRYRRFPSRLKYSLYNFFQIMRCKEPYDVLYGTSFYGLELVIFCRALGLYRKPIAVWHHQAVVRNPSKLKNLISRFFYKGIDEMFFFSRTLIEASLKSGKVTADRLHLIHWGADLAFYDHLKQNLPVSGKEEPEKYFISTGKENRDFATLLKAFAETALPIDIFTTPTAGDKDYETLLKQYAPFSNIRVHFTDGIIPHRLAVEVCRSEAVVICCLDYPYTVGLTTLVEAFALGLPVICSRNLTFGMDVEKEGAGIYVDYNDTEGWKKAVEYLYTHPAEAQRMGANGRKLAEREFNLEQYSRELSEILTGMVRTYCK